MDEFVLCWINMMIPLPSEPLTALTCFIEETAIGAGTGRGVRGSRAMAPWYLAWNMGISIKWRVWGVPKMDGLQSKMPFKWMITRGTPISGNPHMIQDDSVGKWNGALESKMMIKQAVKGTFQGWYGAIQLFFFSWGSHGLAENWSCAIGTARIIYPIYPIYPVLGGNGHQPSLISLIFI